MRLNACALSVALALGAGTAQAEVAGHCFVPEGATGCAALAPVSADGVLKPGTHAIFGKPTNRYPHGVLGDDLEWGALTLIVQGSAAHGPFLTAEVDLPEDRVFEDLSPRLADLDGDGAFEIVVVESDNRLGAQLAVYGVDAATDSLVKQAATPPIGRAFRWLAPVGIADFDDDGRMDIAYVETPHLGKTLRVWTWDDGALVARASASGLTNHRIGEDFISGGVRMCGARPEIITADAAWSRVVGTSFGDGGALVFRDIGPFEGPNSFAAALAC